MKHWEWLNKKRRQILHFASALSHHPRQYSAARRHFLAMKSPLSGRLALQENSAASTTEVTSQLLYLPATPLTFWTPASCTLLQSLLPHPRLPSEPGPASGSAPRSPWLHKGVRHLSPSSPPPEPGNYTWSKLWLPELHECKTQASVPSPDPHHWLCARD